jgi:DNA-binding transcriptional MerR regulator
MNFDELRELLAEARQARHKQLLEILKDHQSKTADIDRQILEALENEAKRHHEEFKERCSEVLESFRNLT